MVRGRIGARNGVGAGGRRAQLVPALICSGPGSAGERASWSRRRSTSARWRAIVSATKTNAELFCMADRIGTIEEGKDADLILVDGDPLADIGVLVQPERLHLVLKRGEPVRDLRGERLRAVPRRRAARASYPPSGIRTGARRCCRRGRRRSCPAGPAGGTGRTRRRCRYSNGSVSARSSKNAVGVVVALLVVDLEHLEALRVFLVVERLDRRAAPSCRARTTSPRSSPRRPSRAGRSVSRRCRRGRAARSPVPAGR